MKELVDQQSKTQQVLKETDEIVCEHERLVRLYFSRLTLAAGFYVRYQKLVSYLHKILKNKFLF